MLREQDLTQGHLRGRHHRDWVRTLDLLRSRGDDDRGLELLLECMRAAEDEARAVGGFPHPGYAYRIAVIHRRRRNPAAEVEVIERWIAACPRPPDPHCRLVVRLIRARRLLAASMERSSAP